ncbi:hypothetical protein A8990_111123 [Paenibacillus taihuensis]|uniref:Uncharacterized protein n=1 Tax=Paenibacillus taihuensis TaxID=1156355 RepID=A0A3D9SCI8_9BACL|nr:hypothetical protein [Paenibacillus taihuensis]REE86226.1 hypothetical protein A8990_111123 [Paenibacillus taihuensis]
MNWNEKEREVRLELIASLTRSQRAIARILESIADSAQHSPGLADVISRNMKSLAALQQTLTAMSMAAAEPARGQLASKPCKPASKRVPAKPWFSSSLCHEQRDAAAGRHHSPPKRKRRN